jgi:hypothetical protein
MTTINVRGFARAEVSPDFAAIHCSANAEADSAVEAQDRAADIATAMRAATAETAGVRSLRLSRVSVYERQQWNDTTQTQESAGWSATISGVCEADVAEAGAVAGMLVEAGATIGHLQWCLEEDNPAYREVRTRAVHDARRAAEDFAAALSARVGELISLADPGLLTGGGPEAMPRAAMFDGVRAAKAVPIDSVDIEVSASVEASYRLDDAKN